MRFDVIVFVCTFAPIAAGGGLAIDNLGAEINSGVGLELALATAGDQTSAGDAGVFAGVSGMRTATVALTGTIDAVPFGDVDFQTISLASPVTIDGNFDLPAGTYFNSNSGLGTDGVHLTLDYALDAGVDLAAEGDRFRFLFGSGDFDIDNRDPADSMTWRLTVSDGANTASADAEVSDEGFYELAFSGFAGVDFQSIDGIMFELFGDVLTPDLVFGGLEVVPSPGAALALGLAGLSVSRRRR